MVTYQFVVRKGRLYWNTTAASWLEGDCASTFVLRDEAKQVVLEHGGKVEEAMVNS